MELGVMAIEFDGATGIIDFGTPSVVNDLEQLTVSAWINLDSFGENNLGIIVNKIDIGIGGWILNSRNAAPVTNGFTFVMIKIGGASGGLWFIEPSNPTGQWNHIAVTYDAGSTANDPIFYWNGSVEAETEDLAPTDVMANDNTIALQIGNRNNSDGNQDRTLDGQIEDIRIYNRILTAAEIAEIYNLRTFSSVPSGLVWQCRGIGAAGLQSYDGATLGASNLLVDNMAGAKGTPAGDPIGRGSVIHSIR